MKIKSTALILCLFMVLSLSGCSKKSEVFRFDLEGDPVNLDPQFSAGSLSSSVLCNAFEGLMKLDSSGSPALAGATGFTVDPSGREYTFSLDRNAAWSNGNPVTAADYQFAFYRLFDPSAPSPLASDFLCIQNAGAVLSRSKPLSALGVTAPDDDTLRITLEYDNPNFTELLCSNAAVPCNKEFFLSTKGKYGLTSSALLSNGAFMIDRWTKDDITLTKNSHYHDADTVQLQSVLIHFLTAGEDKVSRFLSGHSDAVIVDTVDQLKIKNKGYKISGSKNTVWVLVYNTRGIFSDASLRKALSGTIELKNLSLSDSDGYTPAEGFVTPSVSLSQTPYRSYAGAVQISYDIGRSKELLANYFSRNKINKLPKITLVAPDFGKHVSVSSLIQGWQRDLGAYINLSSESAAESLKAVKSGSFDLAIIPLSADYNSPKSILSSFVTGAANNLGGYSNAAYDRLFAQADLARTAEEAVSSYRSLESLLLEECAAVPLFYETRYLATSGSITGVYSSASFDRIYLNKVR